MTTWNLQQSKERPWTGIAVYEHDGIPVLVADVGTYPVAVADDGRTTADTPHILISIGGFSTKPDGADSWQKYYNSVSVTAQGTFHLGWRRALAVFSEAGENEATPDRYIALGKAHLDDAVNTLRDIDARYESAYRVIARKDCYAGPLSRADYEAACAACGVAARSDADCNSYGVRFGNFTYPEYDPEQIVGFALAYQRLQALDAEAQAATAPHPAPRPTPPVQQGQLWEPCERCGREPVYLPLHLCDKCWPKG